MIEKRNKEKSYQRKQIWNQIKKLPAYHARKSFLQALLSSDVVLVVGETGCGKTTQFPQQALNVGYHSIVITQPRRVAAISVAERVCRERGVTLGSQIGYVVRFDDMTSSETKLRYVTDGVLLREAIIDPELSKYDLIFVDEAHERSLQTDIVLGVVKKALTNRRGSLKVVIMSAFFETDKLRGFFSTFDISLLQIEGRLYPVDIFYTKSPLEDYLEAAVVACLQIHLEESFPGDILIFLTGQEEIEIATRMIKERLESYQSLLDKRYRGEELTQFTENNDTLYSLRVYPLFAALSPDDQRAALKPSRNRYRKAILATNIAETSITIPGIKFVIDCGFSKQRLVSNMKNLGALRVSPISQAQALQRAGRAGRECPGKCFRLYTKSDFDKLPFHPIPEVLVSDLVSVTLQLMAMGVDNPLEFELLDKPRMDSFQHALEVLLSIGALESSMKLNMIGKQMAFFPLSPMLSKSLLESITLSCSSSMLALCSILSTESVLQVSFKSRNTAIQAWNKFISFLGDHFTLLQVFQSYLSIPECERTNWCKEHHLNYRSLATAHNIYRQLSQLFQYFQQRYPSSSSISRYEEESEQDRLGRCLVSGFFRQTVRIGKDRQLYTMFEPLKVDIHPSSILHGRLSSNEEEQ
ncbi:pre-mRNA-splicing factor ATP-dependent RNA helicase [Galdieria sulphuraria]|uniref:RNA helicase n=1 Tax=Galdieria sulphuraria TaxID=130081 RepID=M2YAC5_GALSU|nr:pre-mRNA-splicing factor ATP-dependent RNA helicase [Galdieria sulphuraria]EME32829.1 pre-mRNA-splicing factor ATP-dependent RNA helicase [Galdieria sulphuraria]|eukprot:XP_005709349.1 pre-mRNA-splicing factor ATP-dependent RNA helicase [Galdieria sulphuraria]